MTRRTVEEYGGNRITYDDGNPEFTDQYETCDAIPEHIVAKIEPVGQIVLTDGTRYAFGHPFKSIYNHRTDDDIELIVDHIALERSVVVLYGRWRRRMAEDDDGSIPRFERDDQVVAVIPFAHVREVIPMIRNPVRDPEPDE